jgi:hypothetical protein
MERDEIAAVAVGQLLLITLRQTQCPLTPQLLYYKL